MKAITLTQPWASCVAFGVKKYETRSWSTKYRGPLAIHAAKRMPAIARTFLLSNVVAYTARTRAIGIYGGFPMGAVIGRCRLADCVPVEAVEYQLTAMERSLGDYSDGRFAWVLEDAEWFRNPVPVNGMLGLWDWAEGS